MPQQFSNNARSALAAGINDTATSLTISSASADLFPVADVGAAPLPSANDWFKATLQDVTGNFEIVYVRTRASGSAIFSDVMRAQEGTTARSFVVGSVVGLRVTAADVGAALGVLGNDNIFTGTNEFTQPIDADITGNAATATSATTATTATSATTATTATSATSATTATTAAEVATTDFTIEQVGSELVIKNGDTVVASIDASGNFTTAGNVTAYGSL